MSRFTGFFRISLPADARHSDGLAFVSWSARFDEPIALPPGRELVTPGDAETYITKLPTAEHQAPEWQAAMEVLILGARPDSHSRRAIVAR